ALRTAVRRGDLPRNVCELVNKPKLQAPAVQAWTIEQVAQFLTTAATTGDPLLPVWVLLTAAPLRRSELCGLRWGDIDLVEGVLRVERTRHQVNGRLYDDTPKSERRRRVLPRTEVARWALAAWKNAHAAAAQALGHWATDRVMTDADGNEITPNGLYKRFQAARKRAGLPAIRLHSTRSTFGTNWLHQGRPLHQLSALLGHANAGFTLRTYAPVMPSQTAESVAQYGSALRDLLDIDLAGVLGANSGANRAEPGTSSSKD
ncbi:MAG: site-specific integrase, partial [Actinomycetota bacterium]